MTKFINHLREATKDEQSTIKFLQRLRTLTFFLWMVTGFTGMLFGVGGVFFVSFRLTAMSLLSIGLLTLLAFITSSLDNFIAKKREEQQL